MNGYLPNVRSSHDVNNLYSYKFAYAPASNWRNSCSLKPQLQFPSCVSAAIHCNVDLLPLKMLRTCVQPSCKALRSFNVSSEVSKPACSISHNSLFFLRPQIASHDTLSLWIEGMRFAFALFHSRSSRSVSSCGVSWAFRRLRP